MSPIHAQHKVPAVARLWAVGLIVAVMTSACGGGGGGGGGSAPPPTYTVGGTISGLTGTGLVIQNNAGNSLSVAANATTFQFTTALTGGAAYAVTVSTQPTGPSQICTVTNASGTIAAANVTGIAIACKTSSFSVGGTISGLAGAGLTLQDNGGDNLTVAANATQFAFATPLASGAAYAVKVLTQPTDPSQTCTVTGAGGTVAAAAVTSVAVACTTTTFSVGGTVSGLSSGGLVLQDDGGDSLQVAANATSFTFAKPVASGAAYAVTVLTQPAGLTCTVAAGSGNVAAGNVTGVTVACAPTIYSVGGTISGLTSSGLVLQDNAGDNLTVAANATTFTFKTGLHTGAAYAVTVAAQPTGPVENCQVSNGAGSIAGGNVTTISISCSLVGRFLYVANASDGATGAGDVSGFTINPANGTLTAMAGGPVTADQKPSGIVVDPSGQFVYVTNTRTSDVSRFLVDPVQGTLTLRGQFVTKGTGGTAIAVSPSDQYVFVGGYGPNSTGALFGFTLNQDSGALTADPNSPYGASLFPQDLAVDPTGQFLFATAAQKHEVSAYTIGTPATTLLTQVASSPVSTGSTPYGIAVSPTGTTAGGSIFVSNNDRVSVYFYDNLGNLTEAKNSPFPTGTQPEGLAVDPTGAYLYVANYGDGTVSSFAIGAKGQLTAIATESNAVLTGNLTGVPNPGPIDVKVDPAGPYVYVVNNLDGSVSLFTASAGVLTLVATYPTGSGATAAAID